MAVLESRLLMWSCNFPSRPISERREVLQKNMIEIPHHILFSEMKEIRKREDLRDMIYRVLKQGLEGLVLKDVNVSLTAGGL